MGPIDYSIQVKDPFTAGLQGYQSGLAIRQAQQQQELQQQAAEQAQQRQIQMQNLMDRATRPGATAEDFSNVILADPKNSEAYQRAWTAKSEQQQRALAGDLLQWSSAIRNNRPDLASRIMREKAAAIGASGDKAGEQGLLAQAEMVDSYPEFALGQFKALASVNKFGKDAFDALASAGKEERAEKMQPIELRTAEAAAREGEAKATTAEVGAKFAEPKALLEIQEKGWNIEGIKADIGHKKETARIAAMNAALSREGNELKRQELGLKIRDTQAAFEEKARTKIADVQSAAASIDNFINTIDRLKKNPGLRDVVGSIEGADYYPTQLAAGLNAANPLTSSGDDRADAIALIDTMKSQSFLAQVPNMKGMGQLSDAEGKRLESGLQSLSRKQSEKQFDATLDEVQRLMLKARKNVETRYGVKAGPPDTPAVKTSPDDIDALVKKYAP